MLALIAALIFLAELLGVRLGHVNMTVLGLLFVALHLAVGGWVPTPASFRRREGTS